MLSLARILLETTRAHSSAASAQLVIVHSGTMRKRSHLGRTFSQKWVRPIYGISTNYRNLAEHEDERARDILRRKNELGEKELYPYSKSVRAKIPAPATFDYARRPQPNFQDEDVILDTNHQFNAPLALLHGQKIKIFPALLSSGNPAPLYPRAGCSSFVHARIMDRTFTNSVG